MQEVWAKGRESLILDSNIFLRAVLENPLLGERYPREGDVLVLVDTGYEGFMAVPEDVFKALRLGELVTEEGEIVLPNKQVVATRATYAAVKVVEAGVVVEGLFETFEELDELVAGQELLSSLRLVIDYCRGRVEVAACKQPL